MTLKKKEISIPKPDIHLLICINSREHSSMPHCNTHFTFEDFKQFKQWIMAEKLVLKVKITATRCLGMCDKKGSICLVYPEQEYYVFNTIDDLKELVFEKLN